MNETSDADEGPTTTAARELARLQAQTEEERATPSLLQQNVVDAKDREGDSPTATLVEVNERLLLASLRAQTDTEAVTRELNEVSRAAELDALTQLPNRVLLRDRFARAIATARRHGSRLALLFMDLNKFKEINDTLGHAAGDEVLKLVALRLASAVREADTVSRHGGDEFLILLTDVSQASDAGIIAGKLIAALAAPARVGDQILQLTASIGISIYPDDGDAVDKLIAQADTAMYRAKKQGLGSYAFHGEEPAGEQGPEPAALAALQRPLTHYELALAGHEHRHTQLQEANEKLLLATLDAQASKSAAEQTQRRQAEFIAMLARELSNPLVPIRNAAELLGQISPDGPRLIELRAIIEQQVTHMSRLVDELLGQHRRAAA